MNRGAVVAVRGSVVDVRFDQGLPQIYSVLHAGAQGEIVIEVMGQLDARRVWGHCLDGDTGMFLLEGRYSSQSAPKKYYKRSNLRPKTDIVECYEKLPGAPALHFAPCRRVWS